MRPAPLEAMAENVASLSLSSSGTMGHGWFSRPAHVIARPAHEDNE